MAWKRIVNASPLIFLSRLGLLDILNEPGVQVLVPEAALAELTCLDPDDFAAASVRSASWVQVIPASEIPGFLRAWNLGPGETAVLALALSEPSSADEVVIDDGKARRCAARLGIRVQGTLACLLIAKHQGRVKEIRPLIEQLRSTGMYLSDELVRRVLIRAGEPLPPRS